MQSVLHSRQNALSETLTLLVANAFAIATSEDHDMHSIILSL